MRHPTEGTLRRLLDDPAGVTDADRRHVAGCPDCLTGVSAAQRDAALVAAALDAGPAPDVDAAWHRLSSTVASGAVATGAGPVRASTAAPRWRSALRSPVLAVVGVAAVMTGATAAAAGDWLRVFRAEEVAAPTATRAELVTLPEPEDLVAYGDFEVVSEVDVREVADAAAAAEATGLGALDVDELPRGVTGDPTFQVVDEVGAVFTFSTARATATAAELGETLPTPPEGLDGNEFRLAAGPGVLAVWPEARGIPAMLVARAVAPTVYSEGVPYDTAVDYLTSLPGVPADTAALLEEFAGDGTSLPLPLGTDEVTTATADVDGVPATVVTSRDGVVAGVVWVDDGVVTAVAGSLGADELLAVARGLG